MKKFILLHIGFENPSTEVMEEWNAWFASIKDQTIENIGFGQGKEISSGESKDLVWDKEALTGISIIEAESMEDAVNIAEKCPSVTSIRVYEYRG